MKTRPQKLKTIRKLRKKGKSRMKKITILVPAYNEEESLPLLYERVSKIMDSMTNYEFELLLVNDGSKDNTIKEIKELREKDSRVCYVDFSRNLEKR